MNEHDNQATKEAASEATKARQSLVNWWNSQPPVGANKPFIVTLDGKPFAGFDTQEQAKAASAMYATHNGAKASDAFKSRKWEIRS